MTIEHHALIKDLPEYREEIHALKIKNAHFAKMMEGYNDLTTEVEKIEKGGSAVLDEAVAGLKMQRVHLKDELLKMLANEKGACGKACAC